MLVVGKVQFRCEVASPAATKAEKRDPNALPGMGKALEAWVARVSPTNGRRSRQP